MANTDTDIRRLTNMFLADGFAQANIHVYYNPTTALATAKLARPEVKGFGFFGHGNPSGVVLQEQAEFGPFNVWSARGGTTTVVGGNTVATGPGRRFSSLYIHACNQPRDDWMQLVSNGGHFQCTYLSQEYNGFTGAPIWPWPWW